MQHAFQYNYMETTSIQVPAKAELLYTPPHGQRAGSVSTNQSDISRPATDDCQQRSHNYNYIMSIKTMLHT